MLLAPHLTLLLGILTTAYITTMEFKMHPDHCCTIPLSYIYYIPTGHFLLSQNKILFQERNFNVHKAAAKEVLPVLQECGEVLAVL